MKKYILKLYLILLMLSNIQQNKVFSQIKKSNFLLNWNSKTICDLQGIENNVSDTFLIEQLFRKKQFFYCQNDSSSIRSKSYEFLEKFGMSRIAKIFEEYLSGEQFVFTLHLLTKSDSIYSYRLAGDFILLKSKQSNSMVSFQSKLIDAPILEDNFFIQTSFEKLSFEVNGLYFLSVKQLNSLKDFLK